MELILILVSILLLRDLNKIELHRTYKLFESIIEVNKINNGSDLKLFVGGFKNKDIKL